MNINSQTIENKERLQNQLAWGLSNETNADNILENFLNEFQQNERILRISRI